MTTDHAAGSESDASGFESGTFPRLSTPGVARAVDRDERGPERDRSVADTSRPSWCLPAGPFPILMFDRQSGAITAANDAAARAYRYTREELLACAADDLFFVRSPSETFMASLPAGEPQWGTRWTQCRKDGTMFEADVVVVETGEAARMGTMVVVRPLHPDARATPAMPAPTKSSQRYDGDVKAALTPPHRHAKTLLGGAAAVSSSTAREHVLERCRSLAIESARALERDLDAVGRAHLQRIMGSVLRMNDLLANDAEPLASDASAFAEVDTLALLDEVVDRVRPHADAKGVDIFTRCTCSRARIQPRPFADALCELLQNAVTASKRDHPIIIDVGETRDGDVLWQIQDAGDGMTAAALARLGHPERTRRGTRALGVALAWRVVERHGGLLRFESAPGVGTTASLWLPGACARSHLAPEEPLSAREAVR